MCSEVEISKAKCSEVEISKEKCSELERKVFRSRVLEKCAQK